MEKYSFASHAVTLGSKEKQLTSLPPRTEGDKRSSLSRNISCKKDDTVLKPSTGVLKPINDLDTEARLSVLESEIDESDYFFF